MCFFPETSAEVLELSTILRMNRTIIFGKVIIFLYYALSRSIYLFQIYTCFLYWMFLRSIKEMNRSISNEMTNIYLNSNYWEELTFSKLRFFKLKKIVLRSIFGEVLLTLVIMFPNPFSKPENFCLIWEKIFS